MVHMQIITEHAEANTNWRSKYEACGLYNTPIDEKYKPIFKGGAEE